MKRFLQTILVILNLACFFIVIMLWTFIGAWAILYVPLYLTFFIYVSNLFKLWEFSDEENKRYTEFTKGKTYLGYDYYYSSEIWKDDITGEIIEL